MTTRFEKAQWKAWHRQQAKTHSQELFHCFMVGLILSIFIIAILVLSFASIISIVTVFLTAVFVLAIASIVFVLIICFGAICLGKKEISFLLRGF